MSEALLLCAASLALSREKFCQGASSVNVTIVFQAAIHETEINKHTCELYLSVNTVKMRRVMTKVTESEIIVDKGERVYMYICVSS
jgi:hypothetical protein